MAVINSMMIDGASGLVRPANPRTAPAGKNRQGEQASNDFNVMSTQRDKMNVNRHSDNRAPE